MLRKKIVKGAENSDLVLHKILRALETQDPLLMYSNPEYLTDVQRFLNKHDIRQYKSSSILPVGADTKVPD